MRFRIVNPLWAIGCGQFGLSIMQVMFMFYYVKVYLNVFHVPQIWFTIAQVLFMVWNAINDPLFGYIQDTPGSWLNSRTRVIKFFSIFLVASFVFMWIPWSTEGTSLEGIHLILSLFLYDAFFSAIGVAWSALFADSTREPKLRVSAMKYSQISILLSVNIIGVTEHFSHSLENMFNFRVITVLVALLALSCLHIAGSLKPALPYFKTETTDDQENLLASEGDQDNDGIKRQESKNAGLSLDTAWVMTKDVVKQRDFLCIIAANFIQNARSVAHMNFASTATELLIPQEILPKGSLRLSLFYGVLTIGPQILLILNEKTVNRHGAYRIMTASYFISMLSGLLYLTSSNPYCIMLFMLIDSITVHSVAPLFNIIISDFIDDDAKRFERRSALSSLVFSLNALFVKPAQSLAPVVIVYFLNSFGYKDYLSSKTNSTDLQSGMLYALYTTPLLLGALQYFAFRPYSLGNKHLEAGETHNI